MNEFQRIKSKKSDSGNGRMETARIKFESAGIESTSRRLWRFLRREEVVGRFDTKIFRIEYLASEFVDIDP